MSVHLSIRRAHRMAPRLGHLFMLCVSAALLSACGGGGGGDASGDQSGRVSGNVSALSATGLVLTDGTNTVELDANAPTFTLSGLASGQAFNITVARQPLGFTQFCTVSNGSGTAGSASNVTVTCENADAQVSVLAGQYQRHYTASGVAIDANGNFYVIDGNQIIKITADGAISTFAGSGDYGSSDGSGTQASFESPTALAIDAAGNVYVADANSNLIRKITPDGLVSTLAGGSPLGYADGTGADAGFYDPRALGVDADGNVYVAEAANNTIRKITPEGVVTTLAGSQRAGSADGNGANASFSYPSGIAVSASGTVYVADYFNSKIRQITPDGDVTTLAGGTWGYADGMGSAAQFDGPYKLAVDAQGNVFVGEAGNLRIRVVKPDGEVSTLAGDGSGGEWDGTGTDAGFGTFAGMAFDASGTLYVSSNNSSLRQVTADGVVTTVFASPSSTDGPAAEAGFSGPRGVAVDAAGNTYVTETDNNLIRKITRDGVVSTFAGSGDAGQDNGIGDAASFNNPTGIAVDASGHVYVADSGNNVIRKITPDGAVSTLAGSGSRGSTDGAGTEASFSNPVGIAVDAAGNVYVADAWNSVIRKITPDGVVTTLAGSADEAGVSKLSSSVARIESTPASVDGNGAQARFSYPQGVTVDAAGNVYVADSGNGLIRKITPNGDVTTLAGGGVRDMGPGLPFPFPFPMPMPMPEPMAPIKESKGSVDGIGTAASFDSPNGVAVDAAGNVYVADTHSNLIRKITPAAEVTTLAGSESGGSANGIGTRATFRTPYGLAVDRAGNLIIADTGNNMVRKITPQAPLSDD